MFKRFLPEDKSYFWLIIFLGCYLTLIASIIGLNAAKWVDEGHFYRTICFFASSPSLDTLKTYNELITPLTFILYALWGKIFSLDLPVLRFFSLVIAFLTHFSFFYLLNKVFLSNKKLVYGVFTVWLFNPYILGLNIFLYTDMLSMFFIIWFIYALLYEKIWLVFITITCMIYTRQYNLAVVLASGIFVFLTILQTGKSWFNKLLLMFVLGGLTILPLFIFWEGFTPQSIMSKPLDGYSYSFQKSALSIYTYSLFIYTLPLSLVFILMKSSQRKVEWLVALLTSPLYFFIPVEASWAAKLSGVNTAGFFHKLILKWVTLPLLINIIFYSVFTAGLFLIVSVAKSSYEEIIVEKRVGFSVLCWINIVVFIGAMTFSFQVWEKYILVILPFVLIWLGHQLAGSKGNIEMYN